MTAPFVGAKGATFIGDRLLIILRDDRPDIPFPDHWDFPGGGREAGETGLETFGRELREEVGLDLADAEVLSEKYLPSMTAPKDMAWFFVVRFPEGYENRIVFGPEGQSWDLATPEAFLAKSKIAGRLAERLRQWQAEAG